MWTDREYELIKIFGLHRYDANANPDKVGLGQCGCGKNMYWCEFHEHLAGVVIDVLGIDNPLPQPPIWVGLHRNRCADVDMTGGVRCGLRPDHDGDHDYTLGVAVNA